VVGGRAVAIPGSDATSLDALDGAAIEPFEEQSFRITLLFVFISNHLNYIK
jgi:hypothetical protein